jgi:hypothetical protein
MGSPSNSDSARSLPDLSVVDEDDDDDDDEEEAADRYRAGTPARAHSGTANATRVAAAIAEAEVVQTGFKQTVAGSEREGPRQTGRTDGTRAIAVEYERIGRTIDSGTRTLMRAAPDSA